MGRITVDEAKKYISLVAYLAKHNHFPVGMSGKRHRFRSVFRNEKDPSMFVDDAEGLWNDFGHGGGDIVTLAQQMHNFSSIPETLEHLTQFVGVLDTKPEISPSNQNSLFDSPDGKIHNIRVLPLNHFVLLKYLREKRCIDEKVAKHYLRLVLYDNENRKDLFAIGWENDSGAFELRSAGSKDFKAVTGKKDISTFSNSKSKTAYIFESMLDFLSALMMKNQMYLEGTVFVLNSTSLVKRVIPTLEREDFDTIHTFLDNDKGGREAFEVLKGGPFDVSKINQQTFYKDFNDVNDYWVGKNLKTS